MLDTTQCEFIALTLPAPIPAALLPKTPYAWNLFEPAARRTADRGTAQWRSFTRAVLSVAKSKIPNDPAIIPSQRSETADYLDRLTSRTHHRLHH